MNGSIKELKKRYRDELEKKLTVSSDDLKPIKTKEYVQFKKELKPKSVDWYEKLCNSFEHIFKFTPSPKARQKLLEQINIAHMNVTPEGVYTLSYLLPLSLLLLSVVGFALVPMLIGGNISMFFLGMAMIVSLLLIVPLQKYPSYLATAWRLKSSNQMVLCVFYLVTYMRQSSNLERAIEFAGDHLDPPLSLDLKKILWNVENRTFSSMTDALDEYLISWKRFSDEFIDAIHLIQSSLLEGNESRRLALLDKSLDVILEGTYEKMLHYAQNLKNPITTLHMLGVILPVLGLVILPLAVSFMEGLQWYHLAVFYNFLLPIVVFFLSKSILSTRPAGYGDSDISEHIKGLKKYKKVGIFGKKIRMSPALIGGMIFVVLLLIGLIPIFVFPAGVEDTCWDFKNEGFFCNDIEEEACRITYCAWQYKLVEGQFSQLILNPNSFDVRDKLDRGADVIGPFGVIAALMSLLIPIGAGVGLGYYYKMRSTRVLKVRKETKMMEKEFSTALFQLGNRLGDGLPAELAIPRVATIMEGSISGNFFSQVSMNMQKLGMGLAPAIFDKEHGAINYFPSKIIESAMKVLVESVKKGPLVAAQAVNNIARYIKEIHRVNERLKDLLADIISSMRQQINFLAPMISGVVVGITSMITFILGRLKTQAAGFDVGDASSFLTMMGEGIPTYFFQLVVGLYVVEIVFILSIMANSIENGNDKLGERATLGKNLLKSTMLYATIAFFVMMAFQLMAGEIISKTGLI
ncbi:hypothetical protein HN592_01725 [Candidatus Woesearchaeota archaeon]|jgi:hypothetical protein|nr:hypothetical protein [Candidatus Woesearchaeota archaeon]MBT4368599.1 hypothetical protein [Candidatus Woesearchaeota archaeon]MBT4713092.1 hypothetical protein [Candidatus Woesearchaeota archaeon]MBT6639014.1 hypothetical protein [Candidatus Woesearchaeota archaeon]MBT7134213.1 hypothetical protein [Candidatus Woesearchaeota archaeon]